MFMCKRRKDGFKSGSRLDYYKNSRNILGGYKLTCDQLVDMYPTQN